MACVPGMAMTELHLRPARPDDMKSCANIFNAWADQTEWMPRVHPHDDVIRYYQDVLFAKNSVTIAESLGQVVGYLARQDDHINALYVAKSARRGGIGYALIGFAKAQARALTLWTFRANTAARAFYQMQGFTSLRSTEGDNEEGLPDILLGWTREATP